MKIGILTYHSIYNFGANLQAYSTSNYLLNNGYEPVVINWVPKELEDGYKKGNPPEQAKAHTEFIENKLPLTNICRNTEDVVNAIKEYNIEAVIIGSDAVLQHKTLLSRLYITKKGIKAKPKRSNVIFPNPFWGSFIPFLEKKIPVAVMSASGQNMNYKMIRGAVKHKIGKALINFNFISTRDEWTRDMVSYFTNRKIIPEITPDPVFAFNQNIKEQPTKEEILKKFNLPEKYVLFSFKNSGRVDNEWLKRCKEELESSDKSAILLTMPGGIIFENPPLKTIAPPLSPIDWYSLIKYSSGYIGENMHPIVVALHNSVPFFSFDSYGIVKFKYKVNEESSKIFHILEKAGFLDYRASTLGKKYKMPDPNEVIKHINIFDREKCSQFSAKQLISYNTMMEEMLKNF